jgi:hypothetical protein
LFNAVFKKDMLFGFGVEGTDDSYSELNVHDVSYLLVSLVSLSGMVETPRLAGSHVGRGDRPFYDVTCQE